MNKRQFVQSRRTAWQKFRKLLDRMESGSAKQLSPQEIEEYSQLLREVSNDLAVIRSNDWGRDIAEFLNHLVTRGYNNFYAAPPGGVTGFLLFLAVGFPRLLRKNWGYFLAGWCVFFLPMFIAWGVTQINPAAASSILPAEQLEVMEEMYAEDLYEDDVSVSAWGDSRTAMAGFYVWNNVGIALRSFGLGILLGVGTLYTLLYNGLVIGATAGYLIAQGHGNNFLSFAVTHGSFELTAIAVAGGAGLMLGDAVIHRGNRTFRESLIDRGLDAVKVAAGAAAMLFVAAGIEAFWSPAPIPDVAKYAVGLSSWVFVYAWLLLAGRWQ